jgi:hypothetical protein
LEWDFRSAKEDQMSLLRSDCCQVRPLALVSEVGSSGLQRLLTIVPQRLVVGALGYCLLAGAGCSFDAHPNNAGVRSKTNNTTSDPSWKPPSAADGGRKAVASATAELDGATDAMPSETVSAEPRGADAGASRAQPSAASGAAVTASAGRGPLGRDASVPTQDAGKPGVSKGRDAQPSSGKPDAAPRDAAAEDVSRTSGHCKGGAYTGTFSGSIQLIGLSLSSVTGVVRADLMLNASGEHLDMHDGSVMGVDQDGNRLTVNLSGSVNCKTDQLENGKLENGNFHNLGSAGDTAFMGSAEATYSRDPHSVVGTFSVAATDSSLLTGRGTWTLIRSNE